MGFRLGPGYHKNTARATPPWWAVLIGVLVAGGVGWLVVRAIFGGSLKQPAGDMELDSRPVIISLQQLGELHTVKVNMKDVLRKSSDLPAEGWAQSVPGADAVSRWATHNEALVVAEGSVEAGIDLSHLSPKDVAPGRLSDGRKGLRVHLPAPVVFAPNVRISVEKTESGLMWRDQNIVPKAQAEASRRFIDAAERDHILDHARENALLRLQQTEQLLGNRNVEFYF